QGGARTRLRKRPRFSIHLVAGCPIPSHRYGSEPAAAWGSPLRQSFSAPGGCVLPGWSIPARNPAPFYGNAPAVCAATAQGAAWTVLRPAGLARPATAGAVAGR